MTTTLKAWCILIASLASLTPSFGADKKSLFSADNPNAFVILPKPKILQQYGFGDFCKDTSTYGCPTLSHRTYAGMKGYFTSMDPVARIEDFEFRPVVLENGQKFFYVSSTKLGAYSGVGPIENLSATAKLHQSVGSKIAPGSTIGIQSIDKRDYWYSYKLTNGAVLRTDQYELAAKLLQRIPEEAKRDEFLKLLSGGAFIRHDKIDEVFFIDRPVDLKAPLTVYVGVKGPTAWLRMKTFYSSDEWLFARSYAIVAGANRYESAVADFERDHTGGTVWEWRDESPNAAQLALLRAVVAEPEVTVRFRGKFNADRKPTAEHRAAIGTALKLHALLAR